MYLVYYYATISGHSRIKAAMLQLSNCTLSHSFYSSEAGCQNKSCLPQILVYLVFHLITGVCHYVMSESHSAMDLQNQTCFLMKSDIRYWTQWRRASLPGHCFIRVNHEQTSVKAKVHRPRSLPVGRGHSRHEELRVGHADGARHAACHASRHRLGVLSLPPAATSPEKIRYIAVKCSS